MKIEKIIRDDHQAKLTVEVENERLDEMKRRAAAKIARKVKLPGFRPGKAPYQVVLRQVGEAAVLEEAIEMLVDEIYPQVIKESEIHTYGPGELEGVPNMDPLTFNFVIPLEPEVILGDYHSVQMPYELSEITEEDIDTVLRDLRERQAVIEPVERPAQPGDLVSVLLSGRRLNVAEDQEETLIKEQSYPIIIPMESEGEAEEWPYPGFSQELIGLAAGDEKDVQYTYPEDYSEEDLRLSEVEFHIQVENVKARTLPDVDDELAKSLGEFDNLEEMRSEISNSLRAERERDYNQQYDDAILTQALENSTVKFPPQMLDREIDEVIHNLEHRLADQNITLDLYLKSRNIDMQAFRKEVEPMAIERLKRGLFLVEFGKAENIKIDPQELEKEALGTLSYLHQTMDEKEARKLADREVQSNIIGSVLAELLTAKAIRKFRDMARGIVEQEQSAEEPAGEDAGSDDGEQLQDAPQMVEDNVEASDLPETAVPGTVNLSTSTEESASENE